MNRLQYNLLEEGLLPVEAAFVSAPGSTRAPSQIADPEHLEEERLLLDKRTVQNPAWTIDRGAGYYAQERERKRLPSLVQQGRHAGRSRVSVTGVNWQQVMHHRLKRDLFHSAVNTHLHIILGVLLLLFLASTCIWSALYWAVWSMYDECFIGFSGPLSAVLFAIETQMTIGYGVRAPGECWATAVCVAAHSLLTVVLDSVIIGIALARVSHPKNRGRTILISDCATIARRDGDLKFMFRVADIQVRPVVQPRVRAFLFTWGPDKAGRMTSEGEHVPVKVQELGVSYCDPTLLLPVVCEHTIDERSALWGLTQPALEALGAEIVVVFEGTTELGDLFSVRQSYLPQEIHWGHVFAPIIAHAPPGSTQHTVDIARFHDVEPQPGLTLVVPSKLSRKVMAATERGSVPGPTLGGNTLVLSDEAVVGMRDGRRFLMFRVGDSFPGGCQMVNVQITAHIFRWRPRTTAEGEVIPYTAQQLALYPDQPTLRIPVTVLHPLDEEGSPLAAWTSVDAKRQDADAELLVTVRATCYATSQTVMRTKSYSVLSGVRWGAIYAPLLPANTGSGARMSGLTVDWSAFHTTIGISMDGPAPGRGGLPPGARVSHTSGLRSPSVSSTPSGSFKGIDAGSSLMMSTVAQPGGLTQDLVQQHLQQQEGVRTAMPSSGSKASRAGQAAGRASRAAASPGGAPTALAHPHLPPALREGHTLEAAPSAACGPATASVRAGSHDAATAPRAAHHAEASSPYGQAVSMRLQADGQGAAAAPGLGAWGSVQDLQAHGALAGGAARQAQTQPHAEGSGTPPAGSSTGGAAGPGCGLPTSAPSTLRGPPPPTPLPPASAAHAGSRVSAIGRASPTGPLSREHSMPLEEVVRRPRVTAGSSTTTTAAGAKDGADWKQTRSLFAAMEELRQFYEQPPALEPPAGSPQEPDP